MEVIMTETIRIEFQAIEDMIKTCNNAAQSLDDTSQQMKSVATTFEGGVFLGQAGEAYVDAIRTGLIPSISRLSEKFIEIAGDLQGTLSDFISEDQEASSRLAD